MPDSCLGGRREECIEDLLRLNPGFENADFLAEEMLVGS